MPRWLSRKLLPLAALAAVPALAACGSQGIELAKDDPLYPAAVLFQQRCAGCHTLDAVGAEGSAFRANSRERRDGPNFNTRAVDAESVLYAIQNGGFSSNPMPQNLVVGRDAELVACFVAKYSARGTGRGEEAADRTSPTPGREGPTGTTGGEDAFGGETPDVDCPS